MVFSLLYFTRRLFCLYPFLLLSSVGLMIACVMAALFHLFTLYIHPWLSFRVVLIDLRGMFGDKKKGGPGLVDGPGTLA